MDNQIEAQDPAKLKLATKMAEVAAKPVFQDILAKAANYEVASANIRVTNDDEEKLAVGALGEVKRAYNDAESMRKEIVAFPNLWLKTVNNTFKAVKDKLHLIEGRYKAGVLAYKSKKEAEFRKSQEQAMAAQNRALEGDGATTITADSITIDASQPPEELPKAPETVTRAGGASFSQKTVMKFEVVDRLKLIKGAIGARQEKLPPDLVSVDEKLLRKLVNDQVLTKKQWKTYGVIVTTEKQAQVRV